MEWATSGHFRILPSSPRASDLLLPRHTQLDLLMPTSMAMATFEAAKMHYQRMEAGPLDLQRMVLCQVTGITPWNWLKWTSMRVRGTMPSYSKRIWITRTGFTVLMINRIRGPSSIMDLSTCLNHLSPCSSREMVTFSLVHVLPVRIHWTCPKGSYACRHRSPLEKWGEYMSLNGWGENHLLCSCSAVFILVLSFREKWMISFCSNYEYFVGQSLDWLLGSLEES